MEKIRVDEVVKSFNGFDEIAIRQHFGFDLSDMPGTTTLRAVMFVINRRNGLEDKAAFRESMHMTLGDLEEKFVQGDDVTFESELESGKG